MFHHNTNSRGFTLLELLVVIAIIGILSAVVLASLNSARAKARDSARKAQLKEVQVAFELYYANNGKYHIPGTGQSGGNGTGYFSVSGAPNTVAKGLVDAGVIGAVVTDPLLSADQSAANGHNNYMRYCGWPNSPSVSCDPYAPLSCVTARLENPSDEDRATLENSGLTDDIIGILQNSFSQNYAVCNGSSN